MSVDTFGWRTRKSAQGTQTSSIRKVQFGDNYKQVSGNGLNPVRESWILDWTGSISQAKELRDFLQAHFVTSFYWTNPWGEKKLYRVKEDSIQSSFPTGKKATLSFTFEQSFAP